MPQTSTTAIQLNPKANSIMHLKLRIFSGVLSVSMAFILNGCGGEESSGPVTVPVSGTLFMDNKPLADAEVNFLFEGFTGTGKTDAEGKFQLVQGAVVGENKVFITKWDGDKFEINPDEGMDEGQFEAMNDPAIGSGGAPAPSGPKQLIPARFSDPVKTEIKFPVPEGGTDKADLRIQSK